MSPSTLTERRAFVAFIEGSSALVLLDFSRDGFHTVVAACRDRRAYDEARSVSADVDYGVSTLWKTALGHYYVVFTTREGTNPFPPSAELPERLIKNAEEGPCLDA